MNTLNISHIVSELLQFNECVTIPEFGAFVVNPASAQIDMAKNKISPPGKKITFNKNIVSNDGLLANGISLNEGISHEDANIYLKALVVEINSALNTQNVFDFHEVGTFYRSFENVIKFEPSEHQVLNSFGLDPFHLTPLASQPILSKEVIGSHPGTLKTEIKYVQKTGTFGKIGWGIAAIPFFAYLIWMPTNSGIFNQDRNFQLSNLNPFKSTPCEEYVSRPAGLTEIDLSAKDLLHEDFNEIDYKFAVRETTDVITAEIKEILPDRYQIIGGCFSDKANASRLVAKLQDQGYEAKLFDKKGKLYRVSYGGFPHQNEARKALKKVKANANASAWLLKVR